MERKFLITSIFITLGAIAFLSGYLLIPDPDQQLTTNSLQYSNNQAGSLINRFTNKIEVGLPEDKVPNTLSLSSRKIFSFVNPYSDPKKILAMD